MSGKGLQIFRECKSSTWTNINHAEVCHKEHMVEVLSPSNQEVRITGHLPNHLVSSKDPLLTLVKKKNFLNDSTQKTQQHEKSRLIKTIPYTV